MVVSTRSQVRLSCLLLLASACSGGRTAHDDAAATGGGGTLGASSGGATGSGGSTGSGGVAGSPGSGGSAAGTGGANGSGGATDSGGASGLAGAMGSGGAGAKGSGGIDGVAGAIGSGGVTGAAGSTGAGGRACPACTTYGTPVMTGRLQVSELANLSGMAASWRNPGVLFAHNDMTQAHLFALRPDGTLLARFALPSAGAVDIEDLAVGPCAAGTCVYLADIGGNLSASRVEFAIYRLTEPAVPAAGVSGTTNLTFERIRFAYPDGANHNAESLLVDPKSGAIFVITKLAAGKPSTAYALPATLSTSAVNTARKVADLTVPRSTDMPATSASAHPCGLGFLLRTGNTIYEFRIPATAAFETAFAATPAVVPAATEPQSEAITYHADGRGYFTSGETASAPIFDVGCP